MHIRHLNKHLFAIFFAPDKGGDSSPGTALSLEDKLAKATSDLAEAQTKIASIATLTSERDTALANVACLQKQFDDLSTTASAAQTELATTQSALLTEQSAHVTTKNTLTTAQGNIGRLEQLCGLKGIDPTSAVPAAPKGDAPQSQAEWVSKMKSAATPEARTKIASDFEAAVKAGQVTK